MKRVLTAIFFTVVCFSLTVVQANDQDRTEKLRADREAKAKEFDGFIEKAEQEERDACKNVDRNNPNCDKAKTRLNRLYDDKRSALDRIESDIRRVEDNTRTDCRDYKRDYNEARRKLTEACSQSMGTGGGNSSGLGDCVENAQNCAETEGGSEWSAIRNALTNAGGATLGTGPLTAFAFGGTCPKRTLVDWERRSDKADTDRKSLTDKLTQLEEDMTKVDSDKSKDGAELVEAAQKLQEDLNDASDEIDKKLQEADMQNRETLRKIAAQQSSLQAQVRVAQAGLASLVRARAAMLRTMTDAMIKADCVAKIQQAAKDFLSVAGGGKVSSSWAGMAKGGTNRSTQVKVRYNACIEMARAKREETIETYRSKTIEFEEKIKQAETEQDLLNKQAADLKEALAQQEANALQAKSKKYETAVKKQQLLATKLSEAQTNAEKKKEQKNNAITRAKLELNQVSNKMVDLGPEPKGNKVPAEAVGAGGDALVAWENIPKECRTGDLVKPPFDKTRLQQ